MNRQQTEGALPFLPSAAPVVLWALARPAGASGLAVTLDPADLAAEGARQSASWWAETSEEEKADEWPEGAPDCFQGCDPLRLEGPPDVVARVLADLSGVDPSARLTELGIAVSPKRPSEVLGESERAAAPPPPPPAAVERGAAIGAAILALWGLDVSEASTAAALRVSG